jgi:hypothetical protein
LAYTPALQDRYEPLVPDDLGGKLTMAASATRRPGGGSTRGEAGAASRPAAATAAGTALPAAPADVAADDAGPDMLQWLMYRGSYALAYGVVYAFVFVARLLPQENPVMHGFSDGGRAAVDELGRS